MKNKLALNLESLEITSFETGSATANRGTVRGNGATRGGDTCAAPCPNTIMDPSCEISCAASCISTCEMAPCFSVDETCPCELG
jgi:hypothetical protein